MKKALRIIVPVFLVMLFLSSCSKDPIEKILQHNDIVSLINEKKIGNIRCIISEYGRV
jgi:hypothetical protein